MAVNGDRLGISIRDRMIAINPSGYDFQDTTPAHIGGSGVLDYQEALMKAQGNAITEEFVTYWDETDSGIYLRLNGRTGGQISHGGLIAGESLSLYNNLIAQKGLVIESDGTLSVNTTAYESLVLSDNDIPNKKYVDDHATGTTDHSVLTNRDIAGNHAKLIPSSDGAGAIKITKADATTSVLDFNTSTGLLSVGTASYESLVTTDNSIPNKKYVDEHIISNHDSLSNIHLAASGITYGHIDDQSQTIYGIKTFNSFPLTPSSAPTTNYQTANKKYVDDTVVTAHGSLTGLTTGDAGHTQFALLAGRSSGQTLYGDTASGGNLTLGSTANATKGKIYFGSASVFDEANTRLGIGATSPTFALEVVADPAVTGGANTVNFKSSGDTSATRSVSLNLSHSNSIGAAIRMSRSASATDGASLGLYTQPSGGTITERLSITSAGIVSVTNTTASTTTTTGALLVAGGVGVAGTLTAGGYRSSDGTAGITGNIFVTDSSDGLNYQMIFKNGILVSIEPTA